MLSLSRDVVSAFCSQTSGQVSPSLSSSIALDAPMRNVTNRVPAGAPRFHWAAIAMALLAVFDPDARRKPPATSAGKSAAAPRYLRSHTGPALKMAA